MTLTADLRPGLSSSPSERLCQILKRFHQRGLVGEKGGGNRHSVKTICTSVTDKPGQSVTASLQKPVSQTRHPSICIQWLQRSELPADFAYAFTFHVVQLELKPQAWKTPAKMVF